MSEMTMCAALTFGAPLWLWATLALPVLVGLFVWAEAEAHRRLARLIHTPRLRELLTQGASVGKRRVRFALLMGGIGALITAAAAPRLGVEDQEVHRRGLDVIVIVDVSKSMLATDLPPSRLVRAKLAVQDLAGQLQGDRLGLVAFAGNAFLQAPLTLDYDAVLNATNELDTDLIPRGGTNLGAAIDLALEAFGKASSGNRAIVLLSDGEPTDPSEQAAGKQAAARATEAGIRIYTLGFGTPEGALIPLGDGNFVRDPEGKIVHSKLDEDNLRELAKAAGGFYLRFNGEAAIKTLVSQGLSQLKTGEIDARQARRPIERFQWPLGLGLLCLAAAAGLGERRRSRTTGSVAASAKPQASVAAATIGLTAVLVGFTSQLAWADDAKPELPTGSALDLYRSGHYDEAYRAFEELAKKNPQTDSLQFNAGASAYMGKKYDEALDAFGKALTSNDPGLQAKANYNFANTLFRRGQDQTDREKKVKDWRNAIEHYKSALDTLQGPNANPNAANGAVLTKDTAFNRDFVQKSLDELLKQPPQSKQDKQKQDKQQKQDKKDQSSQDQPQSPQDDKQEQQDKDKRDPSSQSQPRQQSKRDKPDPSQSGEKGSPDQNQPPAPDSNQPQEEGSSPPKDPSQAQKNQGSRPPSSGPSPSPSEGKSGMQDSSQNQPDPGASSNQTPAPSSALNPDRARQHGDFQAQPGNPTPAPSGSPVPTPGGDQPTPGEAPAEEAGKMSQAQARALLDSLKDQDQHVNLTNPQNPADDNVRKDW